MATSTRLCCAALLLVAFFIFPSVAIARSGPVAQPPSIASLRNKMNALRPAMVRAVETRNVALFVSHIERIATPDFTYTRPDGQVLNLKQTEALQAAELQRMKSVNHMSGAIQSVQRDGSGVSAVIEQQLSGTSLDNKDILRPFSSVETVREFWVIRAGEWKLKHMSLLSITETVDGRTYRAVEKSATG